MRWKVNRWGVHSVVFGLNGQAVSDFSLRSPHPPSVVFSRLSMWHRSRNKCSANEFTRVPKSLWWAVYIGYVSWSQNPRLDRPLADLLLEWIFQGFLFVANCVQQKPIQDKSLRKNGVLREPQFENQEWSCASATFAFLNRKFEEHNLSASEHDAVIHVSDPWIRFYVEQPKLGLLQVIKTVL